MGKIDKILTNNAINIEKLNISEKIENILTEKDKNTTLNNLQNIYSCIDVTSLNTTDCRESISEFIESSVNRTEDIEELPNVAAICVYPSQIETVKDILTSNVKIASVAGGFPSSQTFIEVKIAEVALAVSYGAEEIDVVLDLGKFYDKNYEDLVDELTEIKHACKQAKLKVILETGALKDHQEIYNASLLAIEGGADFLKTSTGKGYPGASLETVYVMIQAIKTYKKKTGNLIGLKVSGGISNVDDAITYYSLVKSEMGEDYMNKNYFRIGTSSLTKKLEDEIVKLAK